jgi:uncharacterized membrane protein YdbT with pleckstrin-like domain
MYLLVLFSLKYLTFYIIRPTLKELHIKEYVDDVVYYFKVIYFFFLFIVFLIPVLRIMFTSYELTDERLMVSSGILIRVREELELYRVKDYRVIEPLYLRIFGLSNIELLTSDRTTQIVYLKAISNGHKLTDMIRENVEKMRLSRGVREIDSDRFNG